MRIVHRVRVRHVATAHVGDEARDGVACAERLEGVASYEQILEAVGVRAKQHRVAVARRTVLAATVALGRPRVQWTPAHKDLGDLAVEQGGGPVVHRVQAPEGRGLGRWTLLVHRHGAVGRYVHLERSPAVVVCAVPLRLVTAREVVRHTQLGASRERLYRGRGHTVAPTHVQRRQLRALVQRSEALERVAPSQAQPPERPAPRQRCHAQDGRRVALGVAAVEPFQVGQRGERRQVTHVGAAQVDLAKGRTVGHPRARRQVRALECGGQVEARDRRPSRAEVVRDERIRDQPRVDRDRLCRVLAVWPPPDREREAGECTGVGKERRPDVLRQPVDEAHRHRTQVGTGEQRQQRRDALGGAKVDVPADVQRSERGRGLRQPVDEGLRARVPHRQPLQRGQHGQRLGERHRVHLQHPQRPPTRPQQPRVVEPWTADDEQLLQPPQRPQRREVGHVRQVHQVQPLELRERRHRAEVGEGHICMFTVL